MRILWSSNAPWCPSGYGQQTALFIKRLKDLGHEIAVHAWYGLQGSPLVADGILHLPSHNQPYGQDVQDAHARFFQADIQLTLIDAWVMNTESYASARWVPWFPIDAEPCPNPVVDKVRQSFAPIVFSKFGVDMMRRVGIEPLYVPHGYEPNDLYPMDRLEARRQYGMPEGAFVIGMVAANKDYPPRKAFPQVMEAFAKFAKTHEEAMLYLHTIPNGGANLHELSNKLGITDRVAYSDQYGITLGNHFFNAEKMRLLYNSFDVLASPSLGEGFGVPILEAQACGVPVITGDWTAMGELTFDGWAIPKSEAQTFHNNLGGTWWMASPDAICERFEEAYNRPRRTIGEVSPEVREYEADYVTRKYWKPALENIAQRLEGAKEMEALLKCTA